MRAIMLWIECLLLALSGHSDDHVSMSGFGLKADMQIDAMNVRYAQVTNSNSLCCNGNIGHWSNMRAGRVLTHLDIQVVVHNVDWISLFCAICFAYCQRSFGLCWRRSHCSSRDQ